MALYIRPTNTIQELDTEGMLRRIEESGRTCYKSESAITPDSSEKFIRMIIKRGHESVLEHEKISARVICDRGVTHEIVRHRIASYSQECISGDTEVTKNYTIKELYNRKNNCYGKTHNKTISLKSSNLDGEIVPNHMIDVFYKGKARVFQVVTKYGYKMKSTKHHEYQLPNNDFIQLEKLKVGDSLMVNGRPCLLKISDEQLNTLYLENKLSPSEISNQFHVPYTTVLGRLQKQNIFQNHMNDKNKEKYQKNHTDISYEKMKNTIKEQFKNQRTAWNKGLTESVSESVKIQAETLRKHHHNNEGGEHNSNWGGGPTGHIEARILLENISICEVCNNSNGVQVHHKDLDPLNNDRENILKVCINCHEKLHHGWHISTKTHSDEIISITDMGIEDVYDISMQSPLNNYIANGFVVHNSTRYCNYSGGVTFIIPPWVITDEGDSEDLSHSLDSESPAWTWLSHCDDCETRYKALLENGWTPQMARSILPNSLKTEIVMTMNLREWRYFFKLRTAKAAHPQMREIAIDLYGQMADVLPIFFDDIAVDEIEPL